MYPDYHVRPRYGFREQKFRRLSKIKLIATLKVQEGAAVSALSVDLLKLGYVNINWVSVSQESM